MTTIINTGVTTPEAVTAPEGHDQAMLDKVAQKEAELATNGQDAPEAEKILGKFGSQEELAKAYQELERKLSQGKQEEAPKVESPADMTEDKLGEMLEKGGVDVESMAQHYTENLELTDDHYSQLEKAGIPRAYVDQYLSGLEAEAVQLQTAIYNEVGGEQQFKTMAAWAVANLPKAELEAYNEAVDTADMATVRSAVLGLAYQYEKANGSEPKLLNGVGGKAAQGFESLAQLTEAMKDPRYGRDPAYRREVEQKLARSSLM